MVAKIKQFLLIIFILGLTFAAGNSEQGPKFDRWSYDQLSRYYAVRGLANDKLVIIDIDPAALQQLGGWPLSRGVHAQAIDRLTSADAASVTYNIAFAEPDLTETSHDSTLLAAIKHNGRVVLPLIVEKGREVYPFAQVELSGAVLAHADLSPDQDGLLRRSYLWAGMQYPRWPSLALATLQRYAPVKANDHSGLRTPYLHIGFSDLWSRDHEVWLPMGLKPFVQNLQRFSFTELIEGRIPAEHLKNRAIFIGISDSRIEAKIPVYGNTLFSSTDIHAFLFSKLNQGVVISPALPVWSSLLGCVMTLCLALAVLGGMSLRGRLVLVMWAGLIAWLPVALISKGYWISYFPMLVGCMAVILTYFSGVVSRSLQKSPA